MIKGWAFNPPPHWPKPPGSWMPPAGWQPDPAWGPVPPGWQLWIPEHRPQRRRGALLGAGLAMLLATAVVGTAVPRESGPPAGDPLAGGSSLLRPTLRAALIAPVATRAPLKRVPPSPVPTLTPVIDPSHRFMTCSALNRVYPNGLGLPEAVDRSFGPPVIDFGRSTSLYRANRAHDRDGDGIACEPS